MNRGFLFFIVGGFIAGLIIFGLTLIILGDNVRNTDENYYELYIPTGAGYQDILDTLEHSNILRNIRSFDWVAQKMNYPNTVEPGKYLIPNNISNRNLVTSLRNGYGEQEVIIAIHSIDNKGELAQLIANALEADSAELHRLLLSDSVAGTAGRSMDDFWALVLADTYQFEWDTSPVQFMDRMQREFDKFWTDERISKARALQLSPMDCIIIASIIERESSKVDEYPRIAGVYINRLQRGWPLQADPTIKFALNRPEIKRIINEHLEVESPYNTYKYKGLPPGPIGLPEKNSIEAVLNAEDHDYMYFCANSDFSGYHVFSETLAGHNRNARKYQRVLNESGIF